MKKKVAILLPWLKMGGTNKIAINFMKELEQYCDVTLILSCETGELLMDVPAGVHVIIDKMKDFKEIFHEDILKFKLINIIKDCIYYLKIKTGKDSIDNYRYLVERHSYITDEEFDCVISYHGQSPERLLNLLYRVHGKKRVAWIHGEMSFSQKQCSKMKKYYLQLDHFYFVSEPTMMSFAKVIPFDLSKGTVYYNPIDKLDILEKADASVEPAFSQDSFNILTVGRISSEKGQDMIPGIVRKLLDEKYPVYWYIVGDGPNRHQVETLIEQYGVAEHVKLLGVKTNPYCYMKACDLYVQPSYTEGYSTTICEAGMLGKAIIGTKPSGGIRDQITDGRDGLIVEASENSLIGGIRKLMTDISLKQHFESEILNKNFEGKGEIQKFLKFIDE